MMQNHQAAPAAAVDTTISSISSFDDFCTAEERTIQSTRDMYANDDNAKQQNPVAPQLTKDGYYTIPPYATLCHLSTEELMAVDNFAVGCKGLGCVQWYGPIDVTNLNLDELVIFAMREVIVYPNEEAKHAVGSGLNKPALVELLNVFPPTQASKRQQYIDRVQARTESMDATFVDYCPEAGVWKFRVEHFSRYGFEEEEERVERKKDEQQSAMKHVTMECRRSPAPVSPPPAPARHLDTRHGDNDDDDDMSVLHAVVTQKSHVQPDRLRHWQRVYQMNVHGEPQKQHVGGKEENGFLNDSLTSGMSSIHDEPRQPQKGQLSPSAMMKTVARRPTTFKPRPVVEEPIMARCKRENRRPALLQVGYCHESRVSIYL
jgi:hypothetical protein